jgi:hypothetical protein
MVRRKEFRTWASYKPYWHLYDAADGDAEKLKTSILQAWKDNREDAGPAGTEMHKRIEDHYNGKALIPEDTPVPELKYFLAFAKEQEKAGLTPYRSEWMIFHPKYFISGSIDMVYYRQSDDTYHMVDWKRKKGLKEGKKSCFGVLNHWLGSDANKIKMQLNLYHLILKLYYGVSMSTLRGLILHPNQKTYQVIDVPIEEDLMLQVLQDSVQSGILPEYPLQPANPMMYPKFFDQDQDQDQDQGQGQGQDQEQKQEPQNHVSADVQPNILLNLHVNPPSDCTTLHTEDAFPTTIEIAKH